MLCPCSTSAQSVLPTLFLWVKPTRSPRLSIKQADTPSFHPWKPLVDTSISGLISLCRNWLLDWEPLESKGGSDSVPLCTLPFPVTCHLVFWGSNSGSHHLPGVKRPQQGCQAVVIYQVGLLLLLRGLGETQTYRGVTRHLAPSRPRRRELCYVVKPL